MDQVESNLVSARSLFYADLFTARSLRVLGEEALRQGTRFASEPAVGLSVKQILAASCQASTPQTSNRLLSPTSLIQAVLVFRKA